ncbi:MAG: hypothetical protein U0075_21940 [Thermomicrobiales bacterium]
MLDDILDLFNRRKRQHDADRASSARNSGLPFDLPFLDDDDDEDGRDRRHDNERRSASRSSSSRRTDDNDWF